MRLVSSSARRDIVSILWGKDVDICNQWVSDGEALVSVFHQLAVKQRPSSLRALLAGIGVSKLVISLLSRFIPASNAQ
jgi:hypothetical protein